MKQKIIVILLRWTAIGVTIFTIAVALLLIYINIFGYDFFGYDLTGTVESVIYHTAYVISAITIIFFIYIILYYKA